MCEKRDPVQGAYLRFQQDLVEAGLLVRSGVPGVYGLTGAFEDTIERFEDTRLEDARSTLLREERAAAVRQAIASLPRKQRATLILRTYHDMPHQQIAEVLGSSVGAVKANFFHALANLKKILGSVP